MRSEQLQKINNVIKYFIILLSCIAIIYISKRFNIDWLKSDYYSFSDAIKLYFENIFSLKTGAGNSILIKVLLRFLVAAYIVLFGTLAIITEMIYILYTAYEKIKSKEYKYTMFAMGMMILLGILSYTYILHVYPFVIIIKEFIKIIAILFICAIPVALYFALLYAG